MRHRGRTTSARRDGQRRRESSRGSHPAATRVHVSRSPGRGRLWLAALVVATLLRLALAPWTAWPNDTYAWVRVGWDTLAGLGPYDRLGFSYPPGWAAILALVTRPLAVALPPEQWATYPPTGLADLPVPHPLFLLAVKLPAISADLGVGWLLSRRSRALAAFWLFNPLVVFVSAVHGQYDSLVSLTTVLALAAASSGVSAFSGLAIGTGTVLKFVPIYAGPVVLAASVAAAVRDRDWWAAVRNAAQWGAGLVVGVLPGLTALGGGLGTVVRTRASQATTTVDGLNPGALRRTPWGADSRFWNDSYPALAQVLLITLPLMFALLVLWRGKRALAPGVAGSLAVAALFQPVTQPQYVVWCIPAALLARSRAAIACVLGLSVLALWYYDALAGDLVSFVTQPLSLYAGLGPSVETTMTRYLTYLGGTGAFGGQIVSDTIGQIGTLASGVWAALVLVMVGKAIRNV